MYFVLSFRSQSIITIHYFCCFILLTANQIVVGESEPSRRVGKLGSRTLPYHIGTRRSLLLQFSHHFLPLRCSLHLRNHHHHLHSPPHNHQNSRCPCPCFCFYSFLPSSSSFPSFSPPFSSVSLYSSWILPLQFPPPTESDSRWPESRSIILLMNSPHSLISQPVAGSPPPCFPRPHSPGCRRSRY